MPERWFERHSQNGGPQFCRHSTIYFQMLLWLEGGEEFAWDLPAPRLTNIYQPFSPPEPHKLKLVWGISLRKRFYLITITFPEAQTLGIQFFW